MKIIDDQDTMTLVVITGHVAAGTRLALRRTAIDSPRAVVALGRACGRCLDLDWLHGGGWNRLALLIGDAPTLVGRRIMARMVLLARRWLRRHKRRLARLACLVGVLHRTISV